jgi:VanZ family protein
VVAARRLWLWGPVVFWASLIFALSSFSKLPSPPSGITDKHEHFVAYGVLAALLVRALSNGSWSGVTTRVALAAAVIAALYGVSDEVHQYFVPGRETSIVDLIADVLGAALAASGLRAWAIIRPRS